MTKLSKSGIWAKSLLYLDQHDSTYLKYELNRSYNNGGGVVYMYWKASCRDHPYSTYRKVSYQLQPGRYRWKKVQEQDALKKFPQILYFWPMPLKNAIKT